MHKRIFIYFLLAAFTIGFASCGGCRKTQPAATGCDSPDELAQKYLQAVSSKNNDLFTSLLLNKDDLRPVAKNINKQGITVYQQFVLRDFQTKNRDFLGKPLKFVAFKLGREVVSKDKYGLYKGSTIIAEVSSGDKVAKVNLEINFVSRIGPKWKIFSLRYIKDGKGANPGIPKILPGAKFGPEKGKVQMKIKKVEEPEKEAAPAGEAASDEAAPEPEPESPASEDGGQPAKEPETKTP